MATDASIKANRTNARASTGPKTANGRARSAQNAFKHGLTLHIRFFPEFSAEIEALAREIVGPNAHAEIEGLARQVAEAHLDVCRVRQVRHQFVSSKMKDPLYESQSDRRAKCKFLIRVLSRVFRLKRAKNICTYFVNKTIRVLTHGTGRGREVSINPFAGVQNAFGF